MPRTPVSWDRVAAIPQPSPEHAPARGHWAALRFLLALRDMHRLPAGNGAVARHARDQALAACQAAADELFACRSAAAALGPEHATVVGWLQVEWTEPPGEAELALVLDALVDEHGAAWDQLAVEQRAIVRALAAASTPLKLGELAAAADRLDNKEFLAKHVTPLVRRFGIAEHVGGSRNIAYVLAKLPAGAPDDVVEAAAGLARRLALSSDC